MKRKLLKQKSGFTSGYSEVNGLRMYYEIHGENNPVLVLVHGGGSTIGTTFGKVIPLLVKSHKLIAVELQAHGHTNDRNAPESFQQDADDVAALLQNLGINKASFWGFSNGGNTVMRIAITYPHIVNKLILASTFYKREGMVPGMFDGLKQATIEMMPESLKTAFLEVNPDQDKLLNIFNKDRQRMLEFQDWKKEDIASIKAPTLIINGDRDVILPEHAVEMSRLIKDSHLLILPGGHGEYMGAAESGEPNEIIIRVVVEIIKDFLNDS